MATGFDCATPLTTQTAAAFVNGGYQFVARYLDPGASKALTQAEAGIITNAGLQILSVFETTGNSALGGQSAGAADGATAFSAASSVNQPTGSCIYFAIDFDATTAQMPTIIAYLQAASAAIPGYLTGVYGSYAVIEAVQAAGVCSNFWQTYAWSNGSIASSIQVYQYDDNETLNGIGVDYDESYGNEGFWTTAGAAPYMLATADANSIIPFLSAGYAATTSEPAQAEFHRLANQLRIASGQAQQ